MTKEEKRALILAESLTTYFNKFGYTYSTACWEAHNIFIAKGLVNYKEKREYNYTPHVVIMNDGKLKVEVQIWKR